MTKILDNNGVLYLLSKLLLLFVRQEAGKSLSTNDLTDELKQMILGQFSGSWNDLADRPAAVSHWTNDADYQSAAQVAGSIAAALTASGFQTAVQVSQAIDAALSQFDTNIFVPADVLPDPTEALPNKIYLISAAGGAGSNVLEEWILANGAWERLGSVGVSLDGYFNDTNLIPITNAEIDSMLISLS